MATVKSSQFRRNLAFLLVLAYAAIIFRVSSGPVPPLIAGLSLPDKLLHLGEYAVLGLLLARWFLHESRRTGVVVLVALPALVAGAYGATDEIHQSFVLVREPSYGDLWADLAGGLLGAAAYRVFLLHRLGRGRRAPAALEKIRQAIR